VSEPDDFEDGIVITAEDAKAIARALLKEVLDQAALATGRAVWSLAKAAILPVAIGLLLWLIAARGQSLLLPSPEAVARGVQP